MTRAVQIVNDNGEERMVELPEIQELLDEISNLNLEKYILASELERRFPFKPSKAQDDERRSGVNWPMLAMAATAAAGWIAAVVGWYRVWLG